MKIQFKKILNLTKSLKNKTFLSYITLTSCLTIAILALLPHKAMATVLSSVFQKPLEYAFEGASSKELLLCILLSFIIFALPGEIKEQIRKHNERKLKKEETSQVNQSPKSEKTTKEQNSKETDKNENIEQ